MAAFFGGVRNGAVGDVGRRKIRPANSTVEFTATYLDGTRRRSSRARRPGRRSPTGWSRRKQAVRSDGRQSRLAVSDRSRPDGFGRRSRPGEPPSERRLLDELAVLFVASGYDLRWLMSGICKSQVYQRECAAAAIRRIRLRSACESSRRCRRSSSSIRWNRRWPCRGSGRRQPRDLTDCGRELIARMNEAASNDPGGLQRRHSSGPVADEWPVDGGSDRPGAEPHACGAWWKRRSCRRRRSSTRCIWRC